MSATDSSTSEKESLSPAQLDQVLEPVAGAAHPGLASGDPAPAPAAIQPFDFRSPARLSSSELRRFRLEHEAFAQSLAARLSIQLRLEFGLKLVQLETRSYQRFLQSLADPCELTLFKVEPLRGICILELSPRIGLAIVDRLMGGPGKPSDATRDLSEVELALLDQAVQIILGEWCAQWRQLQELHPVLLGHENTGRFLQTSPLDTTMLCLGLEVHMGDCVEQMQIGFPFPTVEPILHGLTAKLQAAAKEAPQAASRPQPKWNREFDDLPLSIVATWPGIRITARQLASLKVGDVIPLPPDFGEAIRLRLGGAARFAGRLGTTDQHWAVELTELLRT